MLPHVQRGRAVGDVASAEEDADAAGGGGVGFEGAGGEEAAG